MIKAVSGHSGRSRPVRRSPEQVAGEDRTHPEHSSYGLSTRRRSEGRGPACRAVRFAVRPDQAAERAQPAPGAAATSTESESPMSRTTSLIAATTLAAAVSAGVAAGSSHLASPSAPSSAAPNAGLSGTQIQAAFKAAVAKGTAVHVKGAFKQTGQTYSLDVNMDKNGQAEGQVTQNGAVLPVKKVDGITYVQLTPSFLKQEAATDPSLTPDVIKTVQNKWVSSQTSVGKTLASSFGDLTDYNAFTSTLAGGGATATPSLSTPTPGSASASPSSSSGIQLTNLTAAGTASVNGQNMAVYKNTVAGTTAYFAAGGPAYLEKLTTSGVETGAADFVWNKPVSVTPPPASEVFTG